MLHIYYVCLFYYTFYIRVHSNSLLNIPRVKRRVELNKKILPRIPIRVHFIMFLIYVHMRSFNVYIVHRVMSEIAKRELSNRRNHE